jgi:DNA-binding response OmpR family regulator
MTRILLVEDELSVAEPLALYLRREGLEVIHVADARTAHAQFTADFDLVILDWMLPDQPGLELLRQWRRDKPMIPIVFLSARTDPLDKVLALELGADDYLGKPFEPRELLARIRARLRPSRPEPARKHAAVLASGELVLDPETRDVTWRGQPLTLTPKEFELLRFFLGSPNRVFTRDELLNQVWGYDCFPTTRTVDTHVLQLRRKTSPDLIEGIRGVGYRLRQPVAIEGRQR